MDYYGPSEVVSHKTRKIEVEERAAETVNQTMNVVAVIGEVHENPSESAGPRSMHEAVQAPTPSSITRLVNDNVNRGEAEMPDPETTQELVEHQKINAKIQQMQQRPTTGQDDEV